MTEHDHQMEQAADYLRQEEARRRLQALGKRKILTATVGALAAFEKHFGDLLRGNSPAQGFSREEMDARWEECRNEILTGGNNQVRSFEQEIRQYRIDYQESKGGPR